MSSLITVYITCENVEEAKKIGNYLLKKRLVACINIILAVHSMFLWPPKKNHIDETSESLLMCHTLESKYKEIEAEVLKIHSYGNPAIYAIPIIHVSKKYEEWLKGELES